MKFYTLTNFGKFKALTKAGGRRKPNSRLAGSEVVPVTRSEELVPVVLEELVPVKRPEETEVNPVTKCEEVVHLTRLEELVPVIDREDMFHPSWGSQPQEYLASFLIDYQPESQSQPILVNQSQPSLGNQFQPSLGNQSQPSWENQSQLSWRNQSQPSWGNQSQPSLGNQSQLSWGNQSQSSWGNQSQSSWGNQSQSSWGNQSQPSWGNQSQPSYGNESQPSLGNQVQLSCGNQSRPSWGNQSQPSWGDQSQPLQYKETNPQQASSHLPETPEVKVIRVLQTQRNESGNLKDKRNACLYCGEFQSNLISHYYACHYNEKDVKAVFSLKENRHDGKKDELLEELRIRGNYNHNMKVLKEGQGEMIMKK